MDFNHFKEFADIKIGVVTGSDNFFIMPVKGSKIHWI
jgi:hypothetical protein